MTRPITDIFTPTPSPLSELLNVVLITAQVFKDTRAQSLVNMSRAAEDLLVSRGFVSQAAPADSQ